ncbi:MAG: EamA family transporter [Oscillospiraceae bacterium]
MKNVKIKDFILLHMVFLIYTANTTFSKLASGEPLLSPKWILFYGGVLAILFVYAILWQQVLKRMPLTVAYANKSITVIWGIIIGRLFFKETITWNMVVGAAIIIFGIYLVVTGEEEQNG